MNMIFKIKEEDLNLHSKSRLNDKYDEFIERIEEYKMDIKTYNESNDDGKSSQWHLCISGNDYDFTLLALEFGSLSKLFDEN